MGMNESGEGAVVQNCLIEANEDWHMERAISHLKRFHPTRVNFVRVIVVDKDLNAIRVLEANFPEARILICHFHMIKYLKEMRYESEFGKISSDDESQIDAAVHKMEYAVSEGKYNEAHEFMKDICERSSMDQFVKYFEKNWQLGHGTLGCIKALVSFDRGKQREYEYRIGQFRNSNYDEEMSTALRFTTHYVARQIERQYAGGLAKSSRYKFEEDSEESCGITLDKFDDGPQETEMADIEDEAEFEDMFLFVMGQRRNVRQKKIAEDIPEGEVDGAAEVEDLQDPNDANMKRKFGISSSDDDTSQTESSTALV
ncbi:hypothetical protein F441_14887 [Phytophthora nicotianae CJ01A1]|uniref:ZSWIM1/3 RNaseH-like domain-containing protein n=2 Tax=Phytophthora nicotianae TaxID=4792 RepID=W2WF70_PHYNI|nr:hypothetical protein F441_14887 [Phytophthora nicotianae CJ01A1]